MLSSHILQTRRSPAASRSRLPTMRELEVLDYDTAVAHFELALIESAIAAEGGSITKAARRMGIERSRLGKLRKRLRI